MGTVIGDKRWVTGMPELEGPTIVLRLYVAGAAPRSARAIRNVRALCEHLGGRCELEIVDVYQRPALAADAQLLAAPTLVKEVPPPRQRFIGTLNDPSRVLASLGVAPFEEEP